MKVCVVRKPSSSKQSPKDLIQQFESAQIKNLKIDLFYLNDADEIFYCSDESDAEVIAEHALSLQRVIEEKDES